MRYPVAKPDLSGNELAYVTQAVQSSWVSSQGEFLGRLESACREFLGAEHVLLCTNGTVALHLALIGANIGPGDEVIVPTLTYVASANAVHYCGATPVFADSLPDTWCLDPESVRRLITPRTKAIMPVHLYGQPCDMAALRDIAAEHGLALIEDAAEALGSRIDGRHVGTMGDFGTFSFFGNKLITTGEGGLVVCKRAEDLERITLVAHQGMNPERRYWHSVIGYNYRMTNVAAAIGVAQMERVADFLEHRVRLANWYFKRLRHQPTLTLPRDVPDTTHAYWMYGLLLREPALRDPLLRVMAERGIETRPFFYPIHEFPMYRDAPTDRGCPVAADVSRRGLCLPSYFALAESNVVEIVAELTASLASLLPKRRAA